jgi:hypothetical protein
MPSVHLTSLWSLASIAPLVRSNRAEKAIARRMDDRLARLSADLPNQE